MNTDEYIYIPRKPRLGLDRPTYSWKHLGIVLMVGALVLLAMSVVLK